MPPAEVLKSVTPSTILFAGQFFAPEVRRFFLPDLDLHRSWFFPRFLREFPHLNERSAIGFLKGIMESNEFLFLTFEDTRLNGVALAQSMGSGGLEPEPIIWERFVWVGDPANVDQQKVAAFFYPRIGKWAKGLGAKIVHVECKSDVPREMIKALAGRVYETSQAYLRC